MVKKCIFPPENIHILHIHHMQSEISQAVFVSIVMIMAYYL